MSAAACARRSCAANASFVMGGDIAAASSAREDDGSDMRARRTRRYIACEASPRFVGPPCSRAAYAHCASAACCSGLRRWYCSGPRKESHRRIANLHRSYVGSCSCRSECQRLHRADRNRQSWRSDSSPHPPRTSDRCSFARLRAAAGKRSCNRARTRLPGLIRAALKNTGRQRVGKPLRHNHFVASGPTSTKEKPKDVG